MRKWYPWNAVLFLLLLVEIPYSSGFSSQPALSPSYEQTKKSHDAASVTSPRYLAVIALLQAQKSSSFPIDWLSNSPSFLKLSTRDRAFCRILVTTAERRMGQIEKILEVCQNNQKQSKNRQQRKSKVDLLVQTVLVLGATQMLFLDMPPHAAVKETVDLLRADFPQIKGCIPESKIKFVNAVLRRISREGSQTMLEKHTRIEDNAAEWLVKEWKRSWGEEATKTILEAAMLETPRCLTINGYVPGGTLSEASEVTSLYENAVTLPQGSVRIERPPPGAIATWPLYHEGAWWLQDASATVPAIALYNKLSQNGTVPVGEMSVVDLCASPGGKTAQLSSFGFGQVTAVEVSTRRTKRLRENMERLGMSWELEVADGTEWVPEQKAVGVIVDAPCTATGTASKRPDVLRRKPNFDDLMEIQYSLMCHASDNVLDVGGILVYSTCSLLRQESEDQVKHLLQRTEGSKMVLIPVQPGDIPGFDGAIDDDGCIRVLPGYNTGEMGQCDGFFVARFQKVA